jgi:hypothetical protein
MKPRAIKVPSESANAGARIDPATAEFGIKENGITIQQFPISRIKLNPHNARTHSPKQIRQIADNIMAFGFTTPVLVGEDGALYAGHGRCAAANYLGLDKVPAVVIAGLSPAKQRALAIADNKIAENAGWDRARLAIEIPEIAELLAAEGLDVSLLGFEPIEIARLETEFEPAAPSRRRNGMAPDGIDPRWSEAPVVSKTGDLWLLGDHTLLCGDARSADDLARMMGDHRASVAFLDPPRDETTWHAGYAGRENRAVDFPDFLAGAFAAAAAVTRDGGVHFVCTNWQHLGALMAAAQPVYGDPVDGAVWVNSDMQSGALYRGQQEFIAIFAVGGSPRLDEVSRNRRLRSSVWHYPGITGPGSVHALQTERFGKPVALIADALKDTTRRSDIVLDIFAGTGTTILAAQRVQRHARALEAEPRLVDIAVRRWQAATHGNAVHAESRLSFDEVAAHLRRSESLLSPLTNQGAQP